MTALLATHRQEQILQALAAGGGVRVTEMARSLAVSEMTVRRDIAHLADLGLCLKVHGGAAAAATIEPPFAAKAEQHIQVKLALARAAARLVRPGQAVGIGAGSTTYQVAAQLAPRVAADRLTIVTNSLSAAELLISRGLADNCILTGGVSTPSRALTGPVADSSIGALHLDLLFLGVHGMAPRAGFTTPNLAEAATNRALIRAAGQTVVAADSSKWEIVALADIAPIEAASHLFTDGGIGQAAARQLKRLTNLTITDDQ